MAVFRINANMNLLDAALATAGSLEDLFALASANGTSITDALAPGQVLKPTGKVYKQSSTTLNIVREVNQTVIMSGQTLADLALQECGSLEGIFQLAVLNGLAITDNLDEGSNLRYPSRPINQTVRKAFQDNGWKPSSAKTQPGQQLPETLEGVGYWAIEIDFKVS